eukprot:4587244-Pyramimonas_sp.AAC.1
MMLNWYLSWARWRMGPRSTFANLPPCGDPATSDFPILIGLLIHWRSFRYLGARKIWSSIARMTAGKPCLRPAWQSLVMEMLS